MLADKDLQLTTIPDDVNSPVFAAFEMSPLTAWLHITDRCTLRCDYCYLRHIPAEMSLVTGRAAIEGIFRSALAYGYRRVRLKYGGGEPLLRLPFILKLHQYAQELAKQHAIILDGVILSNGTLLTPQIIERLKSLGLRLMLSLDGIGKYHDCQRSYADGRGSFALVERSIELAVSHGLIPDISVTISGRNACGLPEVVAWLLDHDLPFSLNLYRENPQSTSQYDLRLAENRIIEALRAAYHLVAEHPSGRSLLVSLADRASFTIPHLYPCNAGQSYMAFDTHGRVFKCQMDMTLPVSTCRDPNPLATLRSSTIGLQNLPVTEKPECQDCKWRYWCAGGCPLQAYYAHGAYTAKSPNCGIYKALLPELLQLEALRLKNIAHDFRDGSFSI
jgi:uncharacterized protein